MNRLYAALIAISLILASCSLPLPSTTPPESSTTEPDLFDIPWDDRSLFRDGLVASEQSVLEELDQASVYHIELHIADSLHQITGRQEVRYTNAEEIPLDEVHLRLFPNILGGDMSISNLTVDDQPVATRLALEDSLLIIQLASPLEPDERIVLAMDFVVDVPQVIERNYGMLAYTDDVLALAHAYPMIAVYDDEGWNSEIPAQQGDIIYADIAFFLVQISAPRRVTLVTAGYTVQHDQDARRQTLSVASGPARDFYLVASPKHQELTATVGEVTVRSYAPRQARAGAEMALDVAKRAIELFSERYGPFPYTELDIVSTPTLALGIEYPGIIAIASRIYDVGWDPLESPASLYMESTVVHEVGHQWFYNLVGGDQLDDPWLDEALTQFVTLQYYEEVHGPGGGEGFRQHLESRWARVEKADIPIGMPVATYEGADYGAIVYGRGPLFFVALREEMGRANFEAFLREYTETLSWGIATPNALQTLAEKHCACDLQALFDEWVY